MNNFQDEEQHSYGWTDILNDVMMENVEKVKQFLSKNGNANESDVFGITPLHIASWLGNTELVSFLLENGADVNSKSNDALFQALEINQNDYLQWRKDGSEWKDHPMNKNKKK